MKFTIQTKKLEQALGQVSVGISNRSILPILSCVRITARDGLSLCTSDLELFVTENTEAEITEQGSVVVAFNPLSALVRRITSSTITFATTEEGVELRAGELTGTFQTLPEAEFPPPLDVQPQLSFECEWGEFVKPLSKVGYAMSTDTSRYNLMGVGIKPCKGKLEMAASNGTKLAIYNTTIKGNIAAILPDKFVKAVIRNVPFGDVKVSISENAIILIRAGSEIRSMLIEGNFPGYERVVPESGNKIFACSRKDLIEAIQTTSVFLDPDKIGLILSGRGKQLSIACGKKSRMLVMGTDLAGQPDFAISFNYRHMLESLAVLESDEVRLECFEPSAPILIQEGSLKIVLVPVIL